MQYRIRTVDHFDRLVKRLAKKHKSLNINLRELFDSLKEDPTQGVSLGKGCYKLRMAITSKGKGKSGGARIITFVKVINETVFLLSIYDKAEKDDLEPDELTELLALIPDESASEEPES